MPMRPPTFRPAFAPTRAQANRQYDAERRRLSETRKLYGTARWKKRRAQQLQAEPLCRLCLPIATAATVADHVEPHRGDPDRFWNGPLQSLCATCHSSLKQATEASRW